MARDVLAVPISTVGVERLFNMARDIYHYRRSRLKADTISKLMIMKHFDQASLEEETEAMDPELESERIRREHEESDMRKDLEYADDIDISDISDDESDSED